MHTNRMLAGGTVLLAGWLALASTTALAGPVSEHGRLRVEGTRIVDSAGVPFQLRGMSLFWSQWYGKYWNADVVRTLVEDWKVNVVRAAVAAEEVGGYIEAPAANWRLLERVVQAAVEQDIYVIVDWHSHAAHLYADASIAFLERVARTWGHLPNIIYEIYNEPVRRYLPVGDDVGPMATWTEDIKPYSRRAIDAIRAIDPDAIVAVGTPRWSQGVDDASLDPLPDSNIVYVLHFYAGTHAGSLRTSARNALRNGAPLLVTEWGTSPAAGDGPLNLRNSDLWLDFLDSAGIGWLNWSITDKNESSAALLPGASIRGAWPGTAISPSGLWVRARLRTLAGYPTDPADGGPAASAPDTISLPGFIQAEDAGLREGVDFETTTDTGDGVNMGWTDHGDTVSWFIQVPTGGPWTLRARVAAEPGHGGRAVILLDGDSVGRLVVEPTQGWQDWTTVSTDVVLQPGPRVLSFAFEGEAEGLFNLNWLELRAGATRVERRAIRQEPHVSGAIVRIPVRGSWTANAFGANGRTIWSDRGVGDELVLDTRKIDGVGAAWIVVRDTEGSRLIPWVSTAP